jgi:hypothetical protein
MSFWESEARMVAAIGAGRKRGENGRENLAAGALHFAITAR